MVHFRSVAPLKLGSGVLGLVLACLGFSAYAATGVRVGAEVRAALHRDGEVRVLVVLKQEAAPAGEKVTGFRHPGPRIHEVLDEVGKGEARNTVVLQSVPIFISSLSPRGLETVLANPEVARVDLNQNIRGADIYSNQQIRAIEVQELGYRGAGSTVAVLDSGTDILENLDLDPSLDGEECFCPVNSGCCPDGSSRQSGPGSARSVANHGPQVMGVIASAGFRAPLGTAPDVRIFAVRVLDDALVGSFSGILEALDWVYVHRPDIRLVNMSIATGQVFGPNCEAQHAFNEGVRMLSDLFRARGGLFIVAAGNTGKRTGIASPACVEGVLSVGSVDGDDALTNFTNAAPGLGLLAPGVRITSTGSHGRVLPFTGTSASTPHVTAAAALLLSAYPTLSVEILEDRLVQKGKPVLDPRTNFTYSRVDVLESLVFPAELEMHPETLSPRSRGKWVVARLEPQPPFTAAELDPTTLVFSLGGGGSVEVEPVKVEFGDGDGDGIEDLTVRFSRTAVLAAAPGPGLHTGRVEGSFFSGLDCLGTAPIRVLSLRGGGSATEPTP